MVQKSQGQPLAMFFNPINSEINYLPICAGFLPSTVQYDTPRVAPFPIAPPSPIRTSATAGSGFKEQRKRPQRANNEWNFSLTATLQPSVLIFHNARICAAHPANGPCSNRKQCHASSSREEWPHLAMGMR